MTTSDTNRTTTQAATAPAALPGDLGWHLGMVLRGYQSKFEDAVEGLPEGIRGFQVLSSVVHLSPPNQQALGAHLAIDRTVLTYLIDALVEAELVERIPAPTDRRARKIVATTHGRDVLKKYETRVAAFESEMLFCLPAEDSAVFVSILGRLSMDIRGDDPSTNPCAAMDHLRWER